MTEVVTDKGSVYICWDTYDPPDPAKPSYVIDGDTIVVGGHHWRLNGYDAPAYSGSRGHPHCPEEDDLGLKAKLALERLILEGSHNGTLRIVLRRTIDKHKRNIVDIEVNGNNVGETLVEMGLADYFDGTGPKPVFCSCETALAKGAALRADAEFRKQQKKELKRAR